MKLSAVLIRTVLVFCTTLFLAVQNSRALPFNDDMVMNNMKTGRLMRQQPADSVAVGAAESRVTTREEALKLTNPIKGDENSALNGRRLFMVNCSPCHGDIGATPYKPGKVALLPGPNLTLDAYRESPRSAASGGGRSDGSIYGTIHFGSIATLMPAVGWKLSPTEHWDIINYIRKVQNASVN